MPICVSRAARLSVVLVVPLMLGHAERCTARGLRPAAAAKVARVVPGVDVLREMGGESLRGKRLGLITNSTGRTRDGTFTWKVLHDELRLSLVALFSPEHGLSGGAAAGAGIPSGTDAGSGLPLFSLYGETRKPTPEMLKGIDTLVFDIQDVGTRFYTYISTLKLCMEAAARAGVEVVVLDRPNPNTGIRVEGPVLDPRFRSFVGIAPIPLLHGMTAGELARLFNGEGMLEGGLQARLRVIPMRHWRRDMWWEDTGLAWRKTSPNIRTASTAVAYPALGLFEAINVSEGRGTRETFLLAGAPWIEAERLVAALETLGLKGARFYPETFTPQPIPEAPEPAYANEACHGFRLDVIDRDQFQAVRTGLEALAAIRRMYPARFRWEKRGTAFVIDRLLGTDEPRKRIRAGDSVERIVASWKASLERFRRRRARYLLYR